MADAPINEWIRAYTPQLLGVARAFADGDTEAEDLLQEMWVLAYERADQRPPDAPVSAWLHTILLNLGRARWRKHKRRERLMSLWGASSTTSESAASESTVDEPDFRNELWQRVSALPELQRKVLVHRVIDELSTAQTAATLGRAEGTVKASLHRAIATLRERFAHKDTRR